MERALLTANAPVPEPDDDADSDDAPAAGSQLDIALSFIKDGFRRAGQRRYGRRPFQPLSGIDGRNRRPLF
jgi:hypothetical protein